MLSHNLTRLHQLSSQLTFSAARAFSSSEPKVQFHNHNPLVFEFKLNSPKTLNAVDQEMCKIMNSKLQEWHKNPNHAPRVALMSGNGGKAFCAGGDIVSLYHGKKKGVEVSKLTEFFAEEYLLDYSLSQLKNIEQISVWNGIVMGGGVGLTWHSPIRIATDNSLFAMPETAIGFFTDVGGGYFLPRIKDGDFSLGLYLALTGQRVKGKDLVKYGLATHYIPQDKLAHLYEDLSKFVTKDSSKEDIEAIVCDNSEPNAKIGAIPDHDEIRAIFKNDSIHDVINRLESSKTEFASQTKKLLANVSPLAMSVVFEQLKRGSKMSVKEVFEMEFKIASGFFNHTEFFEGVRALLVDKDKQPKWHYTHVKQIKKEDIDFFFNRTESLNLDLYKNL